MINELSQLAAAFDRAGVVAEYTHPRYKRIPKVTKKAPGVHIVLDDGKIYKIESIEREQAAGIKKYGSNQGTFPAMNFVPLYRLTDEAEKKMVSDLIAGETTQFKIDEIQELCRENNWGKKFSKKYRICMQDVPGEMTKLLQKAEIEFLPLQQLIEETHIFEDIAHMHTELKKAAFTMLEQKKEIALALQILFHSGNQEKTAEEDCGTLSVVLDSRGLMKLGLPVAAAEFTRLLNKKLIEADAAIGRGMAGKEEDAFGQVYTPLEEPMPTVKLAAGFEVSLRTMFRGQPCQNRYGRIENATYPISKEMRFKLQAALEWMSSEEHKGVTWISTDKDEALFAYPEVLREHMYSVVNIFKRPNPSEDKPGSKAEFETAAKQFVSEVKRAKTPGTDPMSEHIQYFILRKLDKGRTKVVYTYNTSPMEIERCSEQWSRGCRNLPSFLVQQPTVLFPMEVSDILNMVWRQDGKPSTDKFKPYPRFHGIRILFGEEQPVVRQDLFVLMNNVMNLAPYLGKIGLARSVGHDFPVALLSQTRKTLALMGLLLDQLGIRKERYMQEFPYLFGQMLKISDALHEMYCKVVRNNDVPTTLAGSGLYITGAEQPYKMLAVLGQRMNPYITWAKTYRTKGVEQKGLESWRAGWYLSLYEEIATQLYATWGSRTRFNEEEKAQYFIGYLAAFPKREKKENKDGGNING